MDLESIVQARTELISSHLRISILLYCLAKLVIIIFTLINDGIVTRQANLKKSGLTANLLMACEAIETAQIPFSRFVNPYAVLRLYIRTLYA